MQKCAFRFNGKIKLENQPLIVTFFAENYSIVFKQITSVSEQAETLYLYYRKA